MMAEHPEQLLNFCCEICRQLIRNGAEIYRVEESARHLLIAYGYESGEIFAIPACVILNIQDGEQNYTKSVRIRSSSNNLDKLDRINDLCRQVCRETPPIAEARKQLDAIIQAPAYPVRTSYLAHGFVALFFTLFYGGTFLDAFIAFFCGLAVRATVSSMTRMNANIFFTDLCASAFLVSIPLALSYLGCPIHLDMIVIGAIMLLVPGLAITNVMRDVLAGDFLTALTKLAEVLIISMSLAIGIAMPIGAARMLFGVI